MKKTENDFTTEEKEILDEDIVIDEEYDDDFSEKGEEEYAAAYNRKNVDGIKRIIVVLLLIMCAVPILFCLYLLVKMNGIERKVDLLLEREIANSGKTVGQVAANDVATDDAALDKTLLDQDAYLDLEKNTEANKHNLASSKYGNVTGKITVVEGTEQKLNGKKVYLTFDDGPSRYTEEILDILDQNNVKGTFFVVKSENPQYWQYYTDIVERGHTIAMHSYSHVYDEIYADKEAFMKDVEAIHDFIYDETGVDCKFYRFPGGSSNSVSNVDISELIEYLDSKGITYFDWNALSGDSVDDELTPDELNDNVLEYVRSNEDDSIVLLHDLDYKHETIDGLDSLIKTLKEEGYEILPIDMTTKPVQHFSE